MLRIVSSKTFLLSFLWHAAGPSNARSEVFLQPAEVTSVTALAQCWLNVFCVTKVQKLYTAIHGKYKAICIMKL